MPKMVFLKAETGETRIEKFRGIDHLVIPVIGLVEGVHQGVTSPVPEFTPNAVLEKHVAGWNGRPVTLGHPQKNGQNVSANLPDVLESEQIGTLFNAQFEDGKLHFDAWVEVEKLQDKDGGGEVYSAFESKEIVEVSTGFYGYSSAESGVWNGESYAAVMESIMPDHLAILPIGVKGACSIEDGCGAMRVNCACTDMLKYEGTEDISWALGDNPLQAFIEGYNTHHNTEIDPATPLEDLSTEVVQWIASKTLMGSAEAKSLEALIAMPVINPQTDKLNAGALRTFSEAKDKTGELAKELYEKEFGKGNETPEARFLSQFDFRSNKKKKMSDVDLRIALQQGLSLKGEGHSYVQAIFDDHFVYETWAGEAGYQLVSRTYSISSDGVISFGDEVEVVRPETSYVPVKTNQEKTMSVKEKVDALIANEATKFEESDRKWLEGLEEASLDKLAPEAEKPTVKEPSADDDDEDEDKAPQTAEQYLQAAPPEVREVLDQGLRMHNEKKQKLIADLKANKQCDFSEDELKGMAINQLERLAKLATKDDYSGRGGPRVVANEQPPAQPSVPVPQKLFEMKSA
jgi:hypothetical protein